jgi:hypothetical protein
MADTVDITAGTGTTIATDDVAGVHYQRVKLTDGTADSSTVVAVAGGVEANALRVTIASDSTGVVSVDDNGAALTIDGTVTAELAAGSNNIGDVDIASPLGAGTEAAAVRVTVATDSTGVLSVDDNSSSLTVDNATISVVGGGVEATAQRVTIASDSTGVLSVDDNGGALTVDWAGTAPPIGAGLEATALRVTLATDSTGLVSVDDNAGSLTVDNAALAVVGGGVEATALRVTLASDSTGLVSVDDNAGSLTVDNATISVVGSGTEATAQRVTIASDSTGVLSVDDNGAALTVDWAGTAPPIGAGTEAAALRVTVATNSTGVLSVDDNGAALTVDGTVTANAGTGTFATSNAIVDGWDNAASDGASVAGDTAHDSPDAGEPVKIGAKAVALKADPTAVASNDRTNLYAMRNGIQFTIGGHPNLITKQFNITDADGAQTDLNILNAVVGASDIAVVTHIAVTCSNANTVDVAVRIGFGAANTPAADAAGIILSHPAIAPGSGMVVGNGAGIIGIGAVGEELRMTSGDPTTGAMDVVVGYFIISNA